MAGTSFAAPVVSGGIALLGSASRANALLDESRDARVLKAVILNPADKLSGWDNGQRLVGGVPENYGLAWEGTATGRPVPEPGAWPLFLLGMVVLRHWRSRMTGATRSGE